MIEAGDLNPKADIAILTETAASVLIDADRAAGPVAMNAAMDAATRKAKDVGIGLALVRSTTHTGALGYYALKATQEGVAAIATAGSIPNMAYHGARAAGVSTSPVCIAVPGGDKGPIVLDMASGIVSVGRLTQARRSGQAIPEGWALDKEGNPTTDPQRADIPLPMAGPKGSGLALMVECLTSLIAGNPILADTVGQAGEGTPPPPERPCDRDRYCQVRRSGGVQAGSRPPRRGVEGAAARSRCGRDSDARRARQPCVREAQPRRHTGAAHAVRGARRYGAAARGRTTTAARAFLVLGVCRTHSLRKTARKNGTIGLRNT